MLDARNALLSREDAATSGELDRLLERAMEQLGEGPSPLPEGLAAGHGHTGDVRRLAVRHQWAAAAAAAVVLIVGIGALIVQGSDLEESAQDAGVSSAATQPSDAGDAGSGVATTAAVPETPEASPIPEQRSDESSSADSGEFAGPVGSEGSAEADGDASDTNDKAEPSGSVFAGVHATGQIQLR
jgi:hypothetical protein